ncbi:MAG: hypothetical protein UR26_C0006G0057 [candidate division TM6 bacterium GW2011_GWF2_32_72]|nr:MAG: hypothetical protein UR26_C0006G0057 [candidate division TM6 bacterium GW2011_GWF2_32_72]
MKYILGLLFMGAFLNAVDCDNLGQVKKGIMLVQGQFYVIDEFGEHAVQNCFVDKELRNRTQQEIIEYLNSGCCIFVKKYSDGQYAIQGHVGLPGGGVGGATVGFWGGKFLVHFVGHGIIGVVSALTGPFSTATAGGLEACFFPIIESASNVVGLGAGMALAVLTGPA